MIFSLNWYHVQCDHESCDATIDVSVPFYPVITKPSIDTKTRLAEKLREQHWFMDATEEVMIKTPTWCPFHGPDLTTTKDGDQQQDDR